ncbi:MAG: hypothetical protein BGP25_15810 [Lysobacterales bacterium 63-13]|nr:MAG: hypothetical protein BGP25_15810 [Xanthomonadales bacterium 63-13]
MTRRALDLLENLAPSLELMAGAHVKVLRDNLFWQWVKRLALAVAVFGLAIIYFISTAGFFGYQPSLSSPGVIIIDVSGAIGPDSLASGDRIVPLIESACSNTNTKALVLRINSPGGSPADAERIGAVMDRCKVVKDSSVRRPVLAVIDGVGASAGYMIAAHADRIVANSMALVGSIGVIMSGLEFGGIMDKYGVRSREYTTGTNKGAFSPYREDTKAQAQYAQDLVDSAMVEFKTLVIERRPGLVLETPDLFSGRVWTARPALKIGLIDEVGVLEDILQRDYPDMQRQLLRPRRSLKDTMQVETWTGAFETAIRNASEMRIQ